MTEKDLLPTRVLMLGQGLDQQVRVDRGVLPQEDEPVEVVLEPLGHSLYHGEVGPRPVVADLLVLVGKEDSGVCRQSGPIQGGD